MLAEKPALDEICDGGAAGREGGASPLAASCYEDSDLCSVLGRLARTYTSLWLARATGLADASWALPSRALPPGSAFATSCE